MDNGLVESLLVLHDSLVLFLGDKRGGGSRLGVDVVVKQLGKIGKAAGGHFVQVGDGNTGGQDGVIRVLGGKGGCGLCCESERERNELVVVTMK